jgi:hypothetical protein
MVGELGWMEGDRLERRWERIGGGGRRGGWDAGKRDTMDGKTEKMDGKTAGSGERLGKRWERIG